MGKAQQAAEEQYPALQPDAEELTYPRSALRYFRRRAFISGWEQALPENPDPAVIEAMAKAYPAAYQRAVQNARKGPDGISREEAHRCYVEAMTAAYAAMRGAMQ